MAKKILRIVAGILICLAVALVLHQFFAGWPWEWDEMLSLFHHESVALVTGLIGILLGLLSFKV